MGHVPAHCNLNRTNSTAGPTRFPGRAGEWPASAGPRGGPGPRPEAGVTVSGPTQAQPRLWRCDTHRSSDILNHGLGLNLAWPPGPSLIQITVVTVGFVGRPTLTFARGLACGNHRAFPAGTRTHRGCTSRIRNCDAYPGPLVGPGRPRPAGQRLPVRKTPRPVSHTFPHAPLSG